MLTRRSFLKCGAVAAAAWRPVALLGAEEAPSPIGLEVLGKVAPRESRAVAASPLSVGFETLDRKHFDPARAVPHLAKLGAKWARCQTGWCRCEPAKGRFDFAWLDAVVDSLLKIGVQPWFNLGYGNKLYTPAADETAVGWAPIFDAAPREAWVRFVGKLAEHFRDRVKHWEIWNEPNISQFWKPAKPSAADYVALVKLTAPEIRKAVPDAVLIGGAYAGIPMSYIKGCLEAGMADHVDKLSYHPYRPVPEAGYAGEIAALRKLLDTHKKGVALWQGENGCPSKGGKGSTGALANLEWDETRQAKWLLRRILSDLRLDVELTSYFHTVDLVGYRGKTNFKGLLRGDDYTPKPAYFAYQCLCALFDADTRHKPELALELVGQQKVRLHDAAFARNGRALYAWWLPASLQQPFAPKKLTLRAPTPKDAAIADPVLIDPLTGTVHKLAPAATGDGSLTFESLPLLDYPLLITDRAMAGLRP
ncbi:MAG TPA: beta-galactosidase [Planctomycetota bacterium]|nr:beta-galactosidase [Planctomycetota bacterium]